jgi:uncharacterized membrane protein YhaH (DUF805 family)
MRGFRLFFSPRGRISRGTFWLAACALGVAFIVLFVALEAIAGRASTLILYPPVFWAAFALAAKRYHDRDKSPLWLALLLIPILGVLWVAFELGCRRGTDGENRYGPDPHTRDLDYLVVK